MLVLKKTKLGETDLIITGFSEEGVQVRAVAKGARRPGSRLGVHLELFSIARVLIHQGRSLGIITEAITVCSNEACRSDVLHSAGASVVVELLDHVSSDGDREVRLFPLASEALRCLGEVPEEGVALITAAAALKLVSQLGFRPSLDHCVSCGHSIDPTSLSDESRAFSAFSFEQGGILCEECLPMLEDCNHSTIDPQVIEWAKVLLMERFRDLERYADAEHEALGRELLGFIREWVRFHLVKRLKSLDFLLGFG